MAIVSMLIGKVFAVAEQVLVREIANDELQQKHNMNYI